MKPGEVWKKNFVGTLAGNRPFWNKKRCDNKDARMCVRSHILDDCFGDSPNTESHLPKDEIPSDRKVAYRSYLNKVRRA